VDREVRETLDLKKGGGRDHNKRAGRGGHQRGGKPNETFEKGLPHSNGRRRGD